MTPLRPPIPGSIGRGQRGCGPCPRGEPGRGAEGPPAPLPCPGRCVPPLRPDPAPRAAARCGRPRLPLRGRWPRRRSCVRAARPRIPPARAPSGSSRGEASAGRPRRSSGASERGEHGGGPGGGPWRRRPAAPHGTARHGPPGEPAPLSGAVSAPDCRGETRLWLRVGQAIQFVLCAGFSAKPLIPVMPWMCNPAVSDCHSSHSLVCPHLGLLAMHTQSDFRAAGQQTLARRSRGSWCWAGEGQGEETRVSRRAAPNMLSFSAGCQPVLHQAACKILFVLALNCFFLLQKSCSVSTRMKAKVPSTQLEMESGRYCQPAFFTCARG